MLFNLGDNVRHENLNVLRGGCLLGKQAPEAAPCTVRFVGEEQSGSRAERKSA